MYFTITDELDGLMVCSISEDTIGGTELGSSVIDDAGFFIINLIANKDYFLTRYRSSARSRWSEFISKPHLSNVDPLYELL